MVIHGCIWLSMAIHGYTWLYMAVHGYPWLYMAIHGYPWLSMAIHGYPWLSMAIHGYTWLCMAIHGCTWLSMAVHGSRGDASGENWKYHFTQRDLSAVSNDVISCQLKRWSAVISLPLSHLAYVVIRSVSNLRLKKNISSRGLMWLKTGLQWRQI